MGSVRKARTYLIGLGTVNAGCDAWLEFDDSEHRTIRIDRLDRYLGRIAIFVVN